MTTIRHVAETFVTWSIMSDAIGSIVKLALSLSH
jgi:hypothetical protein